MRLALAVLLLAGCTRAPHDANSKSEENQRGLSVFEFRGATIGVTTRKEAIKMGLVRDCRDEHDKKSWGCDLAGDKAFPTVSKIADIYTTHTLVLFWEDKLYGIDADFSTEQYDKMVAAMTQAYSAPCDTKSEQLHNAFGAQYAGDTVTWCFKGGSLIAQRHRKDKVMSGELTYWPTPAETVTPTFTSNSI